MKKFIAVIVAIILAVSLVPSTYARRVEAEDFSVVYAGSTVDASGLSVGSAFYFYLSVSENSSLYSGHWLVDYPEQYVTPVAYSTTWTEGLTYLINQSYANGNPTSDKPEFVCNIAYEGMTGSNPYGEEGNYYSVVGMYLKSFDYGGVQMGGDFIRLRYRLTAMPADDDLLHDEFGDYFEIPIIVRESRYWIPGTTIGEGEYYHDHENVTVINGKVYIRTTVTHTVNFYDAEGNIVSTQTVEDGQAAEAPTLDRLVMMENGPCVFCGWDAEFDSVTEDMDIHPIYSLIGDVNFDGVVNSEDALLALRGALGITPLTDMQIIVADINNNGQIMSDDALIILRYALGIIPSLV